MSRGIGQGAACGTSAAEEPILGEVPPLDGEDVGVIVGTCIDRLAFFANQIVDKGVTTVIVLFDPASGAGQEEADALVRTLRRHLPPLQVPRRFCVCDLAQWRCGLETRQESRFALTAFHADKSLPMPDDLMRRPAPGAEGCPLPPDFDDLPDVRNRLRQVILAFAASPVDGQWPIPLLTGETGAGKSFAARAVYDALLKMGGAATKRDGAAANAVKGKFVHLNCGEFGREDMNAALFGLKGGAFSGTSKNDTKGAIECAEDGVLFLDEIGALPLELQPRLLTVLDGIYRLHGGVEPKAVKCRFVFGTNENLEDAVRAGRFRFDLYSRINGVTVCLPPVRARISGLRGAAFLDRVTESLCGRFGVRLSRFARILFADFAKAHPWRGNFRELRRFFCRLRMNADPSGLVPAHVMRDLAASFAADDGLSAGAAPAAAEWTALLSHPLLKGRQDLGADEKVTLAFAFACAARAKSPTEAGRLLYAGRKQCNCHKAFQSYIGRRGYRWDANSDGHVVRADEGEMEGANETGASHPLD